MTSAASAALSAGALLRERRASLALRSAAAFFFGIAFLWPAIDLAMLGRLFAGYAFCDGILTLASGGWRLSERRLWPLLIGGGIGVMAAGTAYIWHGINLVVLTDLTVVWAIAAGAVFACAGATLREADPEHLWLLGAIAAFVFSRALLSQLAGDIVVLSTWLGLYTLTMSVLFLKLTMQHYRYRPAQMIDLR